MATAKKPTAAETKAEAAADKGGDRIEFYDARRPGGTIVRVKHNIDAGTTEIVG